MEPGEQDQSVTEKDALEREKLRLEISNLKRKWWQSPALASTLVASLVTIGLSWAGGLFDLRRDQIALETNRAKFERDQVQSDIKVQESLKKALEVDRTSLERERNELSGDIAELRRSALKANEDSKKANAALKVVQIQLTGAKSALQVAQNKEKIASAQLTAVQQELKEVAAPGVELTRIIRRDDEVHLMVTNRGPGPAILRRIRYFVDDAEMQESSAPGMRLQPVLQALGIDHESIYWFAFGADARLPAGDSQRIFWVDKKYVSTWVVDRFTEASARLKIAVCFCSVDDQCNWARFGSVSLDLLGECK